MEYFFGSIITLAILYFANRITTKNNLTANKPIKLLSSQSRNHDVVMSRLGYYVPIASSYEFSDTQASRHYTKHSTMRVVLNNERAYWINENKLFVAELVDGNIDRESAKVVDTMTMDKVELDRVILIVEELTKGAQDDRGNTGNKKLF
jgi:hypothetical protein